MNSHCLCKLFLLYLLLCGNLSIWSKVDLPKQCKDCMVFHCTNSVWYFKYILFWWLFELVFSAIKIIVFVSYIYNVHRKKLSFKWVDERVPLPDYHCEWLHNLPSQSKEEMVYFLTPSTIKDWFFFPSCTTWNLNILLHICLFIYGNFSANFCVDFSLISFPPFFSWGFHLFLLMWQTSISFKKLKDPFYMYASIYFTLSFFVCICYFKLMSSWFTIFY